MNSSSSNVYDTQKIALKTALGVHLEFLGLFFGKDRRLSHDSDPGALAGEE